MRKQTFILLFILFTLIFIFACKNAVKYVYVNPQVNTDVLPYLTKSIKPIENNFKSIIKICQRESKDMKYSYINYYGSGFLKENKIPNDLDISVGIDLGTYEFDGTNAKQIAKDLENKIELFHIYLYSVFFYDKTNHYVTDKSDLLMFNEMRTKKAESVSNIEDGLNKAMSDKLQVLHFNKKYQEKDVDYTFILNQNEVLINDISPFFAYTKGMKYNKSMIDYPREITILPDFYATIKNIKTNKTITIELIEESFMGERFQLSRRFFVPIIFTGNHSLNYIKSLDYLNDEQKYIETRMFNYFRYLNEIEIYFEFVLDNVKLMKRMHQCADIIMPALTAEEQTKIYNDISDVFSNKDIQLANEYSNAIKNLNTLTATAFSFKNAANSGYINSLINVSNNALEELSKNQNYKEETDNLKKYRSHYLQIIQETNNSEKLKKLHDYLDDNFIDISVNVTKIVNSNLKDRPKFLKDYEILKKIYTNAGFHKIEIHRYDLNTIYIVKDDFTKNMTTQDLKNMAKENNLPEIQYKLIDKNAVQKTSKSEIKYVRYNSTDAENKYWQELQDKLLKDKANWKIKRKYVF